MHNPNDEEFTLENCRDSIREILSDATRTRENKQHGKVPKGMLKLLYRTERQLSDNYGVARKVENEKA